MTALEKLYQLFYSTQEENRQLAFELAKSQGYYEHFIEELYKAWMAYPYFQKCKENWDHYLGEMEEQQSNKPLIPPKDIELKRFYLEELAQEFFHSSMDFNGSQGTVLEEFPLPLLNCTFVQQLNLSWNNLSTLPDNIHQLYQLEYLDLSNNANLKQLPSNLGQLTQLKQLALSGAREIFIQKVPATPSPQYLLPEFLRHLTNMRKLLLGDILLDALPDWMKEWRRLEEIILYKEEHSSSTLHLPESLLQCTQLKMLHLNGYPISLPQNIHHLHQLQYLNIQQAHYIPSHIQYLSNLFSLNLSYTTLDLPLHYEGYSIKADLQEQGVPEGVSRVQLYGWEWLKEMTWLKHFIYIDEPPYAFTDLEKEELQAALPQCTFVFEEYC